jgi:catechol 2,3-dioxygenase-like lactoylglutathione lyase family enzyme
MKLIVNIDVPELAQGVAFYTAALGLQLSRTLDGDVAELTGASSAVYLLQNSAGSRPVSTLALARDYSRHWTPVHLDFVVDDIADAARRALEAGAIQQSDCIEWRGAKCITFADPFGNGFCLIEFAADTYLDPGCDQM